jgi:hypothetical protein
MGWRTFLAGAPGACLSPEWMTGVRARVLTWPALERGALDPRLSGPRQQFYEC